MVSSPMLFGFSLPFSHHLCHEIAHLFCCTFLHLPRDVGVGSQREARVEMTEHTRYRFYVYAVLERQGCECVPKSWNLILNLYYSFLSIDETKL